MIDLGYNYRLTDFQCALGLSQLRKLPGWIARRREIAREYDLAFAKLPAITSLDTSSDITHAYHLYVIRLGGAQERGGRSAIFETLRKEGIGVNVHYVPVHLHPFYRKRFGTHPEMCPVAEMAYEQILSLPIFPAMEDREVKEVIEAVRRAVGR